MDIKINPLGKKLIIYGVLLFFIGLIQGALIPYFHQSGMAMIIFGLIWALLNLKEAVLKIAYYSNIFGMYAVWLAITLGAIFGASRALPIAGNGFSASSMIETAVEIIVISGSVAAVISVGLVLFGLLKSRSQNF